MQGAVTRDIRPQGPEQSRDNRPPCAFNSRYFDNEIHPTARVNGGLLIQGTRLKDASNSSYRPPHRDTLAQLRAMQPARFSEDQDPLNAKRQLLLPLAQILQHHQPPQFHKLPTHRMQRRAFRLQPRHLRLPRRPRPHQPRLRAAHVGDPSHRTPRHLLSPTVPNHGQ